MIPSFFTSLLLAIVQSATEFLPVSSSAHLLLCQSFGLTDQGIFSDVALHAGTLLAVIAYFKTDIRRICHHALEPGDSQRLIRNLIIATIPVVIGAIIGIEVISRLRSPVIIAGASIIFGILLWAADRTNKDTNLDLHYMTGWDALYVGLAQVLSLVPGVSRSGIVITCCRALGFSRRDSTKFAMFLSIPTISAACAYVVYETARKHAWADLLNVDVICGTILSSVLGILALRFLMNWLRNSSFAIFAFYRICLGLFVFYYFLF